MPTVYLGEIVVNKKIPKNSSMDILSYQKNDIDNGDMFGATKSTLYNYYNKTTNLGLGGYTNSASKTPSANSNYSLSGLDISSLKSSDFATDSTTESSQYDQSVYASYINAEKERIQKQKDGWDFQREDHFSIGTVYLRIPPTQISVSSEAHNYRYSSLRTPGEVVLTSGRTTTRVDIEVVFNGLDDINYKLRPLLAQIKTTPFLPLENVYLRNIINPFNRQLVDQEYIKNLKNQREDMAKRNDIVHKLLKYSSERDAKSNVIMDSLSRMKKDGYITDSFYDKLSAQPEYIRNPNSIPKEDLYPEDYNQDGSVNISHYIKRNMTVGGRRDQDLFVAEKNLNEISQVTDEISALNKKSNELQIEALDTRFRDRQIVGAISQISISTMPGYPESLGCRLSMYVFNYDPFSIDFAFISGYTNYASTPDITQCDLFIDWYTKRWLADRTDPDRPGLGSYSTGQYMTRISYLKKLSPLDTQGSIENIAQKTVFNVSEGIYITGISTSIKNVIQFLPILSSKNPTCQYMGNLNGDVNITFEITSLPKLEELSQMVEKIGTISRTENRVTKFNYIYIDNPLLSFMGMPFFMIDDYSVDTVPGNPGLYTASLNLIEYKPGQEKFQKLQREGVTAPDDLKKAAAWILGKAHDFISTGGRKGPNAQYESYYNQVADKKYGWFASDRNLIAEFVQGVGTSTEGNKDIRDRILNASNIIPFSRGALNTLRENYGPSFLAYAMTPVGVGGFTARTALDTLSGKMATALDEKTNTRDYRRFGVDFVRALNNLGGEDGFFETHKNLVAEVIVVMRRSDLVRRVFNTSDNTELSQYLNSKTKKQADRDAGKIYCYPDMELPRYGELPNGYIQKNTFKESGIPHNPGDADSSPQTDNAEVDPDFYLYKGSLWGQIDDTNNTFNGVNSGLMTYKKLTAANVDYRLTGAIDENVMSKYLSDKYDASIKDKEDVGGIFSNDDITSEWEGKDLEVVKIIDQDGKESYAIDGDSIKLSNGKTASEFRLLGYNAPEIHESENKHVTDKEHGDKAKNVLSSLLAGKKVRVILGRTQKDEYGRILAQVVAYDGSNSVNVNSKMISMSKELNINLFSNLDNPLALEDEKLFYQSHENYLYTVAEATNTNKVYKVLDAIGGPASNLLFPGLASSVSLVAGLIGGNSYRGKLGKLAKDLFTTSSDKAETVAKDDIGAIVVEAAQDIRKIFPENVISNDPDREWAQRATEKTNNRGGRRFDRESDEHIDLIAKKIRENQKDNTLRMSRAFPTFKLYFIEEDMPEWGRLDDLYSYQAINSIDITKSRTEAADTAIISILNTKGTLDRSLFGLYDKDGRYIERGNTESFDPAKQETRSEQNLEEFVLKPGTLIKIKMGYSSDPDLLDTVFNGMVAEVTGGDILTVVAQGFGVELLHQVSTPSHMVWAPSAFKILDKMITSPEAKHFGKLAWFPEENATTKKLWRRSVWDPANGVFKGASWWRNIGGIRYTLGLADDTRNNNIWTPENSFLYNISHGGWQAFITKDKTIWDVFREMQRRMPGYITTVLPFDNRATAYFGPADFMYWYTDQNKDKERDWNIRHEEDVNDRTEEEKLNMLVNDQGYTKIDKQQMAQEVANLGNHLTNLINSEYRTKVQYKIFNLIDVIQGKTTTSDSVNMAKGFSEIVAPSTLSSTEKDSKTAKAYGYLSRTLADGGKNKLDATIALFGNSYRVLMAYKSNEEAYVSPNGDLLSKKEAVKRYNDTKTSIWDMTNPSRKLVRQYHFKDSFHNIIANNITATSQYMYNKVTVEYGLEAVWFLKKFIESPPGYGRVSAAADDDIWPERIKEKIVQERNAREIITAWNYSLGNLWEEMRKMYSGHLTILGDPDIKPYDFVMVSDYFTEMFGPIEVEQVTHHFSQDTGFVTTIVPNLVCYVNNSLQMGSVTVASAYMDNISERILRIRAIYGLGGLTNLFTPAIANTAANVAFWLTGLSTGRREPISFTPLIYAGRPYIAGVEGLRKTSMFEAVQGHVTRFILQKNRVYEALGNIYETFRLQVNQNLRNLP